MTERGTRGGITATQQALLARAHGRGNWTFLRDGVERRTAAILQGKGLARILPGSGFELTDEGRKWLREHR